MLFISLKNVRFLIFSLGHLVALAWFKSVSNTFYGLLAVLATITPPPPLYARLNLARGQVKLGRRRPWAT
jgi:hypothetical protein